MKIAIIAPVMRKISKNNLYGGIERIILSLVVGAADAGHKVTLYAPFGTDLIHENLEVRLTTSQDVTGMPDLIKKAEDNLFHRIIAEQEQFDIIHTHIEPIIARLGDGNYFNYIKKLVIITMHNQTHLPDNINYYESHKELHNLNFVFISNNQSNPLSFLPNKTVIYNGINIDGLTFNATPNLGQLAFLGRITPEKGIAQAIEIAKMANKKLIIGAVIDPTKQDYYDEEIKPQIDGKNIIYLGEVSNAVKNDVLRTSEALLFPIKWQEPFGLVLVEAMATGTPVIASAMGSVSEIIQDGKTGFIISDLDNSDSYVQKLSIVNTIDRKYCRQVVEKNFTESVMVANYLKYYDLLFLSRTEFH
jgi:glycosyltransferase involved in cell wall biosynthesis